MSVAQLPLALAQRHHNRQLFADRYLDETIPRREAWLALIAEAAPVLARIQAIFAAFTPSTNEAQTERDLVRPVLEALGHTFEVQAALRTPKGTKKPDYFFYPDAAALNANKGKTLTDADLTGALAVGDAKYWERKLDVSAPGEDEDLSRVPADQIAFYMRHAGTPWGILTNGRRWRLYHQDSVERQDRFYEVDLKDLVEAAEPAPFLYFYAFFRRVAFAPPVDDLLTLDGMLRESVDYARGVSESLKAQVFDALRHLAQGFLAVPHNQLDTSSGTLRDIYAGSLIILYRLLFVLYAEARELLPLRESAAYRDEYSLYAVVREAARRLDSGVTLLADTGRTWAKLRDLFGIINAGSPPLKVATFNGGLFDPVRHSFLEHHIVGDAQLQLALDKLARVLSPTSGAKEFIDYRDLAERHLGTIYEGLLEYHLERDEDGRMLKGGADPSALILVNAAGERHRTGSYYTPDFIVQYMVEQTLRPLLDAAIAGKTTDAARIAAVLEVNCLDPAMGSGHFPVAATEYFARYLLELGVTPPADAGAEPDLAYWKRRVAQSCIYGVDLNPLAVDLAKLSLWLATAAKGRPLSFLDHHLRCGNALVGARASELSELPLSRSGRGGRGVRVKAAAAAAAAEAGQLSLLDDAAFAGAMSTAVGSMWLIEGSAGRTVADVKEQERVYATVRADLTERFATLADIVAAAGFGQMPERSTWRALADYATKRDPSDFATPAFERLLKQVRQLKAAQRFFHWDLEFPEVFYDRHGRPLGEQAGFDAVIGNPPYVRQEQLGAVKPYFQAVYPETYHGVADLYVYFYQQGLQLLRAGGRLSYIVTNKWLRAGYGEGLRGLFATQTALERIVNFGHAPIFAGADVFPVIIVIEKPTADADLGERLVQMTNFPREALKLVSIASYVAQSSHPVPQRRLGRAAWSLESSETDALMEKLRQVGVPLVEFAGVKPYYGIKTGFNEAFLIDTPTKERLVREDPRSAELLKPYLRGQDLERWVPEWAGLWMIFTGHGVALEDYPGIQHHLTQHREALERRAGTQAWWQLQATTAFHPLFLQPKLMYQEIQFHPRYCFDDQGLYGNNKTFILPTADRYLLAVLNSPLLWWHNWRYLPHMKDEALTPAGFLMEQIPIAAPSDATRAEVEPAVTRLIALSKTEQAARRDTLDWLRTEFGLEAPGQKLAAFATLSTDEFVEEVRKRRPKAAGKLTPAGLRALRDGYAEQATPAQQARTAALGLERRLAALVTAAYGLTPDEVALLWATAPPRMPVGQVVHE